MAPKPSPAAFPVAFAVVTLVLLLSASVNAHDYFDALRKCILFFEGQRSGRLPPDQRVRWRSHSALRDGDSAGELKTISDQLANVDSPVTNEQLVLQVLSGLNENYDGVGMFIQQMSPLPDFYEVRSKLILEETRKKNNLSAPATAFMASSTNNPTPNSSTMQSHANPTAMRNPTPPSAHYSPHHSYYTQTNDSRTSFEYQNRGRGRGGRNSRGRGRSRGGRRGGYPHQFSYHQWQPNTLNYNPQTWQPNPPHWPTPPVPYPTAPSARTSPSAQSTRPTSQGILGPAPAQAFSAQDFYNPSNIEHALNNLSLNPDQNWYLDTGATNHMTNSTGLPDADTFPPM